MRAWSVLLVVLFACPRPALRARAEAPPSVPVACASAYDPGASLPVPLDEDATLSLPGLVLLAARESWWDLSLHLRDLPAKQQGACWRSLVSASSHRVVQLISQAEPGELAHAQAVTLQARYPVLSKDARFQALFREVSLPVIERCLWSSTQVAPCNAALLALVEADPGDRAFALRAATLAFRYQFSYGALPFFLVAVRDQVDSEFCQDDSLQVATASGLGLPFDYDNAGIARAIAFRWCPRAMRPMLLEALAKPDVSSYFRQNVGNSLRAPP